MYFEYDLFQSSDGKCLRCASFLSKPQYTYRNQKGGKSIQNDFEGWQEIGYHDDIQGGSGDWLGEVPTRRRNGSHDGDGAFSVRRAQALHAAGALIER